MTKRSFGVTVFGVLFIVVGVFCFWLGIKQYSIEHRHWTVDGLAVFMARNVLNLFGVLAGAGMFMLRLWAYRTTLLLAVGWVLVSVVTLLTGATGVAFPIMWLWNGCILWYFLRPGVKAQFQRVK